MSDSVAVFLAEPVELWRQGLRALLATLPGLTVTAEAADGPDAVRKIRSSEPDVALVDAILPRLSSVSVTQYIRYQCPSVRVLLISDEGSSAIAAQAMSEGAQGVLSKQCDSRDLERAIRALNSGKTWVSPDLGHRVSQTSGRFQARNSEHLLTGRERQILQFVVQGWTSRHIAELLGISEPTVNTHRFRIKKKLAVKSPVDLAVRG
jgi:DNA-binding NarL/FixJ family response regulator